MTKLSVVSMLVLLILCQPPPLKGSAQCPAVSLSHNNMNFNLTDLRLGFTPKILSPRNPLKDANTGV